MHHLTQLMLSFEATILALFTYLSKQHKGIICPKVFGEKVHTVCFQGRDCVFLGSIKSGHNSFWPNLNFIRIQKSEKQ